MADTDYVSIQVTTNPTGLTKPGFGTLLYLSYVAAWVERARQYSGVAGVAVDFPSVNGPEQCAARAWFGQTPVPPKMIIGRGANKPTKIIQMSAVSPTTATTFTYLYNVIGDGVTTTQVSFTSDANPTDAEWAAGVVTALNAVVGKNYTASGASSPISVTGGTGAWFAIEVVDVNHTSITETTTDPSGSVAADIVAINAENKNWYQLDTGFNSKAYSIAAANAVEALGNNRIYVVSSNDTTIINTATTGTADLMDQAKTNGYKRTSVQYHPRPAAFYDAALAGANLTFDPGQETWALRTVTGPGVVNLTDNQRANIVAKNGNSYETAFGLGTSFNGMMANGSFIDTRRAIDFIVANMSIAIFIALRPAGGKLPETDNGFAVLGAVVRGFLFSVSTTRQPIVDPTTILVTLQKRVDVSPTDVSTRTYSGIQWNATVQGAVHKVAVQGLIGGA